MNQKMSAKPVTRNSQAIRWCKRHELDIGFRKDWRETSGSDLVPYGATCRVSSTDHPTEFPVTFGYNLIECVNKIIAIQRKTQKEGE